ncbi:MAG TPA: sigma-54 dependent transcriptional regulator [Candidatus Limnocylindria bacterium]|nr:sigma-54 dependent transcriptional regulator [Candidatus Limnocylindria bacterium]
MMFQILVVDDDEQMQFFLKEALERRQYVVTIAPTGAAAIERVAAQRFDLVLLDVRLPDANGVELVERVQKIDRELPIIIMTAHGTRDTAIEAMRHGAYDYFTKPFRLDELEIVVRRALEKGRLLDEIQQLRQKPAGARRRGRLIGSSGAMHEVFRLIDRAGPTDSTVLILGESGTGKELIAEALYEASGRRDKPFVKLNCAAIPETLLESELFGHERGAFTGAVTRKLGKFESADGGTLVLDEIGDMTLATQAKILRVLQERELQRVGGTQTVRVDVRILASTNKDLERAVREGQFRDDLYYRLNVVTIHVPPLRERRDEIPELADHFLAEANAQVGRSIRRLAPDTLGALMEYHWPGNVRELKNAIERAVVVNDGDVLELTSLAPPIRPPDAGAGLAGYRRWEGLDGLPLDEKVAQLERAFVVDALTRAQGVQAAAARLLGVTERSVWHLVKKHRIEVSRIKERSETAS